MYVDMEQKEALIISACQFPDGNATATRQYHLAKMLMELNYSVSILCLSNISKDTEGVFDSIHYCGHSGDKNKTYVGRLLSFKHHIKYYFTKKKNLPNIIFLNEVPLPSFLYVKKYASKKKIYLYHDCVEWFSLEQSVSHTRLNPLMFLAYIQKESINRILLQSEVSITSISKYLHSHFQKRGIPSYYLPVTMDIISYSPNKFNSKNSLNLVYAGSPASKDYIEQVVEALLLLNDDELKRVEFSLFGMSNEELSLVSSISDSSRQRLSVCLHPKGKVSRNTVLEYLKSADFSVLIRSSTARYAKAGFPTKSVEALMSGTPLFLNMTSDLGMYLRDGYDCIEVENETPEAIAVALRRALALTPEEKDQMKKNARKTAEENFDYRLYIESFGQFIQNAK